jgi:N-acetylmuramoyl-L-alanine amidase
MNTNIIQASSPNFDNRTEPAKICSIVIHHTELKNIKQVYDIFENPASKVSSHYLIGRDGSLHQFVDESKRAWHAGISSWRNMDKLNDYSIGIELDNDGEENFSKPLMETLFTLCKDLIEKYQIEERNIVGHSDIAYWRKVDPSHLFDWKLLAQNGIGYFPEFTCANEEIFKLSGSRKEVLDIKIKLAKLGYKIDDLNSDIDPNTYWLLNAFKRRYTPQSYAKDNWDTLSDGRLNELVKRYEL